MDGPIDKWTYSEMDKHMDEWMDIMDGQMDK